VQALPGPAPVGRSIDAAARTRGVAEVPLPQCPTSMVLSLGSFGSSARAAYGIVGFRERDVLPLELFASRAWSVLQTPPPAVPTQSRHRSSKHE